MQLSAVQRWGTLAKLSLKIAFTDTCRYCFIGLWDRDRIKSDGGATWECIWACTETDLRCLDQWLLWSWIPLQTCRTESHLCANLAWFDPVPFACTCHRNASSPRCWELICEFYSCVLWRCQKMSRVDWRRPLMLNNTSRGCEVTSFST